MSATLVGGAANALAVATVNTINKALLTVSVTPSVALTALEVWGKLTLASQWIPIATSQAQLVANLPMVALSDGSAAAFTCPAGVEAALGVDAAMWDFVEVRAKSAGNSVCTTFDRATRMP